MSKNFAIDALGQTAAERIKTLMARLRDPLTGCPWDKAQDFKSILPYTIEEAYEVADAINRADMGELKEELGDLLLQVVFHSQMASEIGAFDFDAVADALTEKMVRRHPHVFGNASIDSAGAQSLSWEATKAAERAAKEDAALPRTLAGVALALPALTRAEKLQKRAARVGFDWPTLGPVLDKLKEEADEIAQAVGEADQAHIHEEIGDYLFAAVNMARHLGVDAEAALRDANQKFMRRFEAVEDKARAAGQDLKTLSLEAMELLWQEAKRDGL